MLFIQRAAMISATMALPAELASVCIFCKRPAADARSIAHVSSESLIEDAPTLPRGAECDHCNIDVLSGFEKTFINDYLGSPARILEVERTKKGKPPAAFWPLDSMRAVDGPDGQRTLQIQLTGKVPETAPGSLEIRLPVEKPVVVSRFLCKCALEALRFFERPEVFDHRLDAARTFAVDPGRSVFIPYAWRLPSAGDRPGFRLLETGNPLGPADFPVPPVLISVPGVVLVTALVPLPTARPFLNAAKAEGWSIRWSDRRPRRQVWRLTMRTLAPTPSRTTRRRPAR